MDEPLLTLEYTLTEPELTALLLSRDGSRRTRFLVFSVLLGLISAYQLTGWITSDGKPAAALLTGLLAAVVIPVLWLAPRAHARQTARRLRQELPPVRLALTGEGFRFGGEPGVPVAFADCEPSLCGDLLILDIAAPSASAQSVGVPRRAAGDEGFALLLEKCGLSH